MSRPTGGGFGARGSCGLTARGRRRGGGRIPAAAGWVLVAALGAVAAPLWTGCKPKSRPRPADRLVIHMDVEPPHLNPILQEDVWLARITLHNVFEGLVRRDPKRLTLGPALATRWQFSEGGRVLTFWLRRGVRFHDGKPFGAKDVIFTLDRVMDPAITAAAARSDLTELKAWKAVGADRVRLTFRRPGFRILEALSHLAILPRHVYGVGDLNHHPANHRPVGTGPFRFASWRRGEAVRLVRFAGYWGEKPALREVVFRLIRSKEKALALARAGRLDLVPRVLPDQACGPRAPVNAAALRKRFRVVTYYPVQFYTVIFNLQNPIFADVRVRQALAHLVDRPLIAKTLFCGRARTITGPYWPDHPGADPTVAPRRFDPARAAALLRQAGWQDRDGDGVLDRDGKRFEVTYLRFAESAVQRRLLPILREQFRKAGIALRVDTVSWTAALGRLKRHQFDLTDLNWHYYYEQDLYQIYHSSQCRGGSNYGCYRNPEVDRLLEQIRATLAPGRRHALERRLHRLLHEAVPGIYLFNIGDVSLVSRRFVGLDPSPEWFTIRTARPAPAGGGR